MILLLPESRCRSWHPSDRGTRWWRRTSQRSDPRARVTRVTPGILTSHSGHVSAREATFAGRLGRRASGAGLGLGVGLPQRREPALAKQLKVELALPGAVEEGPPLVAGVVKYWSVRILGVADRDPAALREDGDLDAGAVAAGRGFPPRESVGIVIR